MNKIEKYMLPEHHNNLYEREAGSSIALAREIGNKLNELIDRINELSQVDLEWKQEQEGTIRKGVLFMKDNLLNSLNELMNLLKDSGFIDDRIEYHCEHLSERLNNLLGKVVNGSITSMDAEVIDARIDGDSAEWNSIGDLMRTIHSLCSMIVNQSFFQSVKVDTPIINGWLDTANNYHSNANTGEGHKCLKFEVNTGESYLIYSEYGWDMPDAVAQDANNNMVKLYNRANSRQVNDEAYVITIPDKAKYLVVNCMYPAKKPISARKIVGCTNKQIINYIDNAVMSMKSKTPVLGTDLINNNSVSTGKAIRNGEVFTLENDGFVVGECSVEAGKIYRISCGGSFECNPYVFYDANDVPVGYMPVFPASSYAYPTYDVIAPINAVKLRVGNCNSVKPTVFTIGGHTDEKSWSHLKWCCLGDSLTEVNSRASKRYFNYVTDKTGIRVVNNGVGGTGYKRDEENNNAFYQRALNIPSDCHVVTIFGGGNDNPYFSSIGEPTDKDTDTLCGCINKTIDNIYSVNPLVKIGVVSMTPWINHTPDSNSAFNDYARAMKEVCEYRGIPFLDLFHLSGFRPNDANYRKLVFSKDGGNGVHPDETGHKIISSHFYTFLESLIGTYSNIR